MMHTMNRRMMHHFSNRERLHGAVANRELHCVIKILIPQGVEELAEMRLNLGRRFEHRGERGEIRCA